MDRKEKLLAGLDVRDSLGLEIGALCRPVVTRQDGQILYVDYTDAQTLREKYKTDVNVDVAAIVEVDGIWGSNTLSEAISGKQVDYIIASHVIEHVPDLVTWLSELRSVLRKDGQVRFAVPDRRFSFDFFRRETNLTDVLQSYIVRARVPQPHSVLDFCLNATDVSCADAWDGKVRPKQAARYHSTDGAVALARDVISNGTYHDVHCWVFTPRSFANLFAELADIGLIDFACHRFFDTQHYELEFFVAVRPCDDRDEIAASWRKMAESVSDFPNKKSVARKIEETEQALIDTQVELSKAQIGLTQKDEQLQIKVAQAEERLGRALRRIEDLEASTSWRITGPMRSISRLLKSR